VFELWTAGAGLWWPMATHSVSGRRDSVLVIEPGVRRVELLRQATTCRRC
jgi:hypothetical protein